MDGHSSRASRSRFRERSLGDSGAASPLVVATDAGLAGAIFLLPFVMGGRQAWGHLILGVLACGAALCWSLHQIIAERPRWRWSGAEPLFVLGVALVALQVVSLPADWLHRISPALEERLPLWHAGSLLGAWTHVSLTPDETLSDLLDVASCMLLFLTAVQRMQTADDAKRMLTWIGSSSAAMAAFGVLQLALGNGRFFWFYEHPFTDATRVAKGAFTNANHFAHFVALGIPVWLWKFATGESAGDARTDAWRPNTGMDKRRSLQQGLAAVCLGIIGAALLLSQSRGGIVTGAAGAGVTLFFLWRQRLVGAGMAFSVCAVAALAGVSLLAFGRNVEALVESSLSEIATTDVDKLDEGEARRRIWEAVIAAAKQFPVLGTGLGSHVEVYPTYYDAPNTGVEYTHAENGYLQIAMETGITGLTLAGLFILMVAYWCLRGMRRSGSAATGPPLAAITAALAMNLMHSLTDFIWYVPGCMALALLLSAVAQRLYQCSIPAAPDPPPQPRLLLRGAWALLAIGLVVFGMFAVRTEWPAVAAEPHWFDYIRLTRAIQNDGELNSIPDDDQPTTDMGLVKRRLQAVLLAARANPHAHRIQLATARAYWQYAQLKQVESESAMPLGELRDAARSNFDSLPEMQAWLDKPGVLGDRRKLLTAADEALRNALAMCPLSARAYLMLSDMAWLNGGTPEDEQLLLQQAFDVRPFDSHVHYVLGRENLRERKLDEALVHWREAFDRDPAYRRQLITMLSKVVPAAFFLDNFGLELDSYKMLREAYRDSPDENGYRLVLQKTALAEARAAKESLGEKAVAHWISACGCFAELKDDRRALASARSAVKANPASFTARLTLGNYLYDLRSFAEAAEHLTWCVRRHPDDEALRHRAENAIMEKGRPSAQFAQEPDSRALR